MMNQLESASLAFELEAIKEAIAAVLGQQLDKLEFLIEQLRSENIRGE